MDKEHCTHPSQEEWDEQEERRQDLYDNPTRENGERFREANNDVLRHYQEDDD